MCGFIGSLFANGGGFDGFNVPQPVPQEATAKTHGFQVVSSCDGVDTAPPPLGEFTAAQEDFR